MQSTEEKMSIFVNRIIKWYEKHGEKSFPWRGVRDPWAILLASFLLRKTTVEQVVKVFPTVLEKFPDPASLCNAYENEVREIIKPLGIEHERSKLLKKVAEILMKQFGGKVPNTLKDLKQLPGVGDYIAREILCLAYGVPEPLLDRNMIRVIGRVFNVKSERKRPHTDPKLWEFAKKLVPKDAENARKFNCGVLDFARMICRPKPLCETCPLRDICYYAFKRHI